MFTSTYMRLPVVCVLLFGGSGISFGQKPPEAKGVAPANHVIVEDTVGGAYFVAKEIHDRFDKLKAEIARLEEQVLAGDVSEAEARTEIDRLQKELADVRKEIQERRVLITAAKVYKTTETGVVGLEKGQAVFIDAGAVEVVGWDKPHLQWELHKTLLSEKELNEEQLKEEFSNIVMHERAIPGGVFSHPRDIFDRSERRLIEQSPFESLWNTDLLELKFTGLLGQEGNCQIIVRLSSPNAGASMSSQWKRRAKLKVYVPKCQAVAIRGARKGVSVRELNANLYIGGNGDYDYDARTQIEGVKGDVFLRNLRMDVVREIDGNVTLVQTVPPENSGTMHVDDFRTSYHYDTDWCQISHVSGNVRGWLLRTKLSLTDVAGQVNLRNEFGSTAVELDKLPADRAHRIVSQSGTVHLLRCEDSDPKRPMFLATECGTIRVQGLRKELDTFAITNNSGTNGYERHWNGYRPPTDPGAFGFWFLPGAMDKILNQEQGWDDNKYLFVFNRAGRTVCETVKEEDDAQK